jgi:hypothetical protein
MIWALLAILGVPIWLVVGALSGALISRRRFRAQDDVFALSRREHGEDNWPRRLAYGRYVHDVLLTNSGLALVRTAVEPVAHMDRLPLDGAEGKLVDPQAWTVTLENGQRFAIAVAAADAHWLADDRHLHRGEGQNPSSEGDVPDRPAGYG